MKVDVTLSVSDIKQEEIVNKTVIVIDSLRATSSILTALHKGCQKVIPVETVGQALQYDGLVDTILVGERYSKKLNGFHLGNSPNQISTMDFKDKTIVITSTNGTKALQKTKKAAHILIGCFLNSTHCIEKAADLRRDIMIVCAGRRGKFAIEDGLTAGMMIHHMRSLYPSLECSDIALMLENNYECKQEMLEQMIREGATGKTLIETMQEEDITYCLQLNLYHITGIYEDDAIVALSEV